MAEAGSLTTPAGFAAIRGVHGEADWMRDSGTASSARETRIACRVTWAVASIAAMAIGGVTYILYRPKSLSMFSWFESLGLDPIVESMRSHAASWAWRPPAWWIGSVPAALWILSGLAAFAALWGGCGSRGAKPWMLAVVAAGMGGELAQSIGLVPGTFDPIDLGASLVAIAVFILLAFSIRRAAPPERST